MDTQVFVSDLSVSESESQCRGYICDLRTAKSEKPLHLGELEPADLSHYSHRTNEKHYVFQVMQVDQGPKNEETCLFYYMTVNQEN